MRKKTPLYLLLIVWITSILYGCGKGADSDAAVTPTAPPQENPLSQETPVPTPTPKPTAVPTPEPDTEQQTDLHPFSDVLGYENYHITVEETSPCLYIWRFYTTIDGETQCIAETFGYDDLPNAHSTDLDGDGVNELIANCTYGDGAERVYIYRVHDDAIQQGYISIDRETQETEYSMSTMWSLAITEIYDPQENTFVITGPSIYDEESNVTITLTYEDRDCFSFQTYNP